MVLCGGIMKCPICGSENTLAVHYLYQYSHEHKICKNSKVSKKYKVNDNGSEEVGILTCENGCNVNDLMWDIEPNGTLIIENKQRKF